MDVIFVFSCVVRKCRMLIYYIYSVNKFVTHRNYKSSLVIHFIE